MGLGLDLRAKTIWANCEKRAATLDRKFRMTYFAKTGLPFWVAKWLYEPFFAFDAFFAESESEKTSAIDASGLERRLKTPTPRWVEKTSVPIATTHIAILSTQIGSLRTTELTLGELRLAAGHRQCSDTTIKRSRSKLFQLLHFVVQLSMVRPCGSEHSSLEIRK
jgi:hypothetical protein